MKRLLSIGMALAMCAISCTDAFAINLLRPDLWFAPAECPVQAPAVKVLTPKIDVLIDRSGDHLAIEAKARTLDSAVRSGWTTNGLAVAHLQSKSESLTHYQQLSDGSWCAWLVKAKVTIGYEDPINVYISRTFPPGSCAYETIHDHEMEHVQIYEQTLAEHLNRAEADLIAALASTSPVKAETAEIADKIIESRINSILTDHVDRISSRARELNRRLDTPENYLAIQSLCNDWG